MKTRCTLYLLLSWLILSHLALPAQTSSDLAKGFTSPPAAARPWVYWFWLNGNITREGITADLEAMKRVGIGGVLIMEVDQGAPTGPVAFMGPAWRELFKHVVAEARRLGLEVNMNNDAGWNGSGGPWIKPDQSMQKVVWSETQLEGGRSFAGPLPQPETVAGFYRDLAVLAFPTPGDFRIDNIQGKAGYERRAVNPASETKLPAAMVIERARIVDLSSQFGEGGRLTWDVPTGAWTVLRLGHTSTGVMNAPAPASGRGLECDKLSTDGIDAQFAGMMAKLIADVGRGAGKTLVATHIDSWENGSQNWTARMREEFRRLRGYDLWPFLPVMTGRVVESLEVSERFLWDLRQTISELVITQYAGRLRELAQRHGVRLSIEAYGGPCDDLTYGGAADEPMCEFWIGGGAMETCKGMASAAHIYGRTIVGAEAFTADDRERWLQHPASIKALGDRAFCDGVNRMVFHRYAMQPWLHYAPGMCMGPWGLHYERTSTWWEQSALWHEYLARCQFLLRQGRFVADVCYLQPEESPQGFAPRPRIQYDFDLCTAEAVLTRMRVDRGRLVLPDGMSYRLLVLPPGKAMTPLLLRKIKELVMTGATVLGPRPTKSPGLTNYPDCDAEVRRLADELWGDCDGKTVREHRCGQGRIVWGVPVDSVLSEAAVRPDFSSRARLGYIHRAVGETDVYFVANPQPQEVQALCAFRVRGKGPEFWWPETGRRERAAAFEEQDGVTRVLLRLGPSGSVFVVFSPTVAAVDPVVRVGRGDQTLLTVEEVAPKVRVERAVYGVLNDPARTRDVCQKVQQLVDAGDGTVAVAQLALGDDPAPSVVKTLVVDYAVGERRFTVTGQDTALVRLSGEGRNITIQKAVYGVLGDAQRTRDVRAKVQRIVETGETGFEVARLAQGDDPAFGIVKTVIVDYTVDGKPAKASGTDPEMIYLDPPVVATERTIELRRLTSGQLLLEAGRGGEYEVRLASGRTWRVSMPELPTAREVSSPWEVRFPPGWGAPERIRLEKLISWSEHSDAGVKYFSGAATYRTAFSMPPNLGGPDRRWYLDLGRVQIMAEVNLNGQPLGLLWQPPFQVEATDALKPGANLLEIKVLNLWPNRVIGDEQLPEDSERNPDGTLKRWPPWVLAGKPSPTGRFTFTSWRLWKKDAALLESGLLGPVQVIPVARKRL